MAIHATELAVINKALTNLGMKRITSSDLSGDLNKAARLVNATYENLRNSLLQDHPWNFAIFRADVTKNAYTPEFDFLYAYDFPNGTTPASKPAALRILEVDEKPYWSWRSGGWFLEPSLHDWKVENNQILSDHDTPLSIKYIGLVTDTAEMTPMFTDLLAEMCAMEWVESLTSSNSLAERIERRFSAKLREARSIDAQEGIPDELETHYWISGRLV